MTEINWEIEELIVVEGKNDAHAVRRALGKVDVIWTEGFGLSEEKLEYISEIAKKRGVIICTDPDFAGQQIRNRLLKRIPQAAIVYLSKEIAVKNGDIGLENVKPEEIRKAFAKVLQPRPVGEKLPDHEEISRQDLLTNGLAGDSGAAAKRAAMGKALGIGDSNAKQFLHRINRLGISREDFFRTLKRIEGIE